MCESAEIRCSPLAAIFVASGLLAYSRGQGMLYLPFETKERHTNLVPSTATEPGTTAWIGERRLSYRGA